MTSFLQAVNALRLELRKMEIEPSTVVVHLPKRELRIVKHRCGLFSPWSDWNDFPFTILGIKFQIREDVL